MFEKGEKFEGDVSTRVDKEDEVMFDVDEWDNFIELEDIFPVELIMDPNGKLISPNLELLDPTSL